MKTGKPEGGYLTIMDRVLVILGDQSVIHPDIVRIAFVELIICFLVIRK